MLFTRRTPFASKTRRHCVVVEGLENRRLLSAAVISAAAVAASPRVTAVTASQQPSVTTVSPASGATGVALNAPVTAALNLPNGGIDPNSVTNATVMLLQTSNNAVVPSVVNTTGGGDALILTPSINLLPATQYTFTITTGVQDINGDPMVAFSENFTTGTTAPPVNQNIAFSKTALPSTQGTAFTDMQIGPDGRLYASTEDGRIFRYAINADGTLGLPQVITSLQTYEGGKRLITGFAFDPASTPSNPIIWVSNTFYALSGATNGPNFTSKLTVMSGQDLATVQDAIIDLPRSISDHVNDQPVFQPGTDNLFFCQAGQNAYGAPDTTWGNRAETLLSAAILEVNTTLLNLSGPALNVLTPDVGGTYNPFAINAPLTIYATGVRNAFPLFFDETGALWAPVNGSSSGGNTPAYSSSNSNQINGNRIDTGMPYNGPNVPALTDVQQTEEDVLDKIVQGGYYGHPDPVRGEYVLDDGNPTTGGVPGLAFTAYPSGTNPDPNYRLPAFVFGLHNSPDGIIEYQGNAFGGALNGDFLVPEYSAGDDIVALSRDSNDNITGADRSISGFSHFTNPVTLIENPATGYLYVSELGGQRITLLKPSSVAPQISASTSVLAFNGVATGNTGAGPSRTESVTITNNGADALVFDAGAFTIVNNPAFSAQDAANFAISNSGNLPTSLASGASAQVQVQYTATITGLQSAILQIDSNDPVTPTLDVTVNGIGTAGQFGYKEPSLVQVLRANDIPTIVGAGPNDVNINTPTYPENPDPSSQEVQMQRLVVAGPGPVTITPLASFNSSATPSVKFGYYTPGNPTSTTELFTIDQADSQTMDPTAQGATIFNPGSSPFSLYAVFPGTYVGVGQTDFHYSEDALNTLDPTHPRKFRFFPMEQPNGTVVPNTYIVAAEDYNNPTYNSFVNFVGVIHNVMPASDATNAPVIGIQNLNGAPGATQLAFTRIQIPNTTVADVVHDTNTLQINNTGDQALILDNLTLSDTKNWAIVNPPASGTSIAPGASLDVTIQFIATTDPAHANNQTNDTATTNGVSVTAAGGVWSGTLTISTNDPVNPSTVVTLKGYWQYQTEHENEPGLQTIVNSIFGYDTNISTKALTEYPNTGTTAVDYGEEVASGLWTVADSTQPVSVVQLDSFHNQYDSTTTPPTVTSALFGYYIQNASTVSFLFRQAPNNGQTIFPNLTGTTSSKSPVTTFTPSGTFGLDIDGEKSQDALNTTDINTYGRSGHAIRFYPLRNSQGNVIPNAWIVAMDYQNGEFDNSDYQDNVYIVTNMAPSGHPPTPTDLQAVESTSGVQLGWAPVTGATGYNVYRATNGGAYTKLTATPVTTISYLDASAPAGMSVNYEVTAVNSSKIESIPANASVNLIGAANGIPGSPPAAPAITQANGASGTQVVVTWAAVSGATNYVVNRSGPGQSLEQVATGLTSTTYIDNNVTPGSTYTYEIQAQNSAGLSPDSAPMSATVTQPAVAPSTPVIQSADGSSGTQVLVTWAPATGATTYNVQREGPGDNSFTQVASGVTGTTFTDTNVVAGSTYQYEVQAQNSAGTSAFSSPLSGTVSVLIVAPLTPANPQANVSDPTQVVLTWDASTGATGYSVERQGPGDSTFIVIAANVTDTTFTDTNVVGGASYQYQVAAQNSAGLSPYTSPVTASLPQPPATLDVAVGAMANKRVQFVDADGTLTTLKMSGHGTATVHFSATTISQAPGKSGDVVTGTDVTIASITTTGTTAASTLNIVTKGGNGTVSIGAISTDASIKAIMAKTATLIGNLSVSGSIGKVTLGTANTAMISATGTVQNLQIGTANGLSISSAGAVKSLSAGTWNSSGSITAPSINSIKIKGDATINLVAGTVHSVTVGGTLQGSTFTLSAASALDLASLKAGSIANTVISAAGNLGSITAATLLDSQIDAGIGTLTAGQTLPATAGDFAAQASIAGVKLKKIKGVPSDINSSIAAAQIKNLSLGTVQFDNGGTPFGVAAIDISMLAALDPATNKPFTLKKLTSAAIVTADLTALGITPQDFVVRIV